MRFKATISLACLALGMALAPVAAFAQDEPVEAAVQQERPAATLADMVWLEGSWAGKGIGGHPAGETFTYAGDKQMVGHFWQLDETGGIGFYELITVVPDGESLTMRLKHFTADLTGWEAKESEAALEFPLLERSEAMWKFGPVTFTQLGPDRLNVSVKVRRDDGSLSSLEFDYDRVSSGESPLG
ncbi:DUF6265 family protein [Altererythrobacter sp. GH1-8]|uniref:DUF6265 family protein n=1 Tax=Altererythrobacter sp. GH1-8 TaxID=3349333 RepID=UPI00374D865C